MIGIYAGRFQPFHLGHFDAIQHLLERCDETFVLICSKRGINLLDDKNPFTYQERKDMMKFYKNRVHFIHICDQESDEEWTRVIEKEMPKGRKVCFTNNPRTAQAFKDHKFEVQPIPIKQNGLNASLIRKLIIRNENWVSLVPSGTETVINEVRHYV
jgi:nicotinamide-nucleotide adenylyltransferase